MSPPITILVVDNDPAIRTLLKVALQQLDVNVLAAANGLEAIDVYMKSPISVVLLDVEMPHLDGPETLKRLQEQGPVACVFMTGGSEHTKDYLVGLGACDVISKPFGSLEKVMEILQECIKNMASNPPSRQDIQE